MRYHIGFSAASEVDRALGECLHGMPGRPRMMVFFSDTARFAEMTRRLHESYGDCLVLGSTTYSAFSSLGSSEQGVTILAFGEEVPCSADVIPDVTRNPSRYSDRIIRCRDEVGTGQGVCCFEMITALLSGEELVQDTFHTALGEGITVFGGSAGNRQIGAPTFVSLNGEVYSEACVFAFINWPGRVMFLREIIFRPTGSTFTVTDVDCELRKVYEFDDIPAAIVAARALGTTVEQLPELMHTHPLGRIFGDDVLITEFRSADEDGSMNWYARLYNHTRLMLLEPDDCDRVFAETARRVREGMPVHSFALAINCASRSRLFEETFGFDRFLKALGESTGNFIGFSGYGEQIGFRHLNQTMVLAVFE